MAIKTKKAVSRIATKKKKKKLIKFGGERYVLVTTEHRGVFAGYASETDGSTIRLREGRLCVYWSADVKGFLGLAANGPSEHCRISPPADIDVRHVTSVSEITPDAQKRWEAEPWGE